MITFSIFLQVPSIIRLTMSETDQTPDIPPDAPPDTSAPDTSASDTSGIRPQAKRKLKAAYPQRKKVCERLDVGYPLDNLKGAQVPKCGQVLHHMAHFLTQTKGSGSAFSAAGLAAETVKRCWLGSNAAMASNLMITKRIISLHKEMK